jgi:hypothetical protein
VTIQAEAANNMEVDNKGEEKQLKSGVIERGVAAHG